MKNLILLFKTLKKSGLLNMFDIRNIQILTGLTRDECLDIMVHYKDYQDALSKKEV